MEKKVYITPALQVVKLSNVLPVATSPIDLTPHGSGDGGDSTKDQGDFDLWDE